jgi:methylated-DNA-protein-cysteine methyltransferase-like protein
MSWAPVYRLVKRIPRGRVTTYGELAKALKLRGGARAVGYAMAACPNGQGIPWHRVIGAGGRLLMPEPQALKQRKLLETEGVALDGARVDMDAYGWSPVKTKKPKTKGKRAKVR